MQAEIAEREARIAAYVPPQPKEKDSVIKAAKICLIVGSLTTIVYIGFIFLFGAFILGIYAMATNRVKQGVVISFLAIGITIVMAILVAFIWTGILAGITAAILKALLPNMTAPPPL